MRRAATSFSLPSERPAVADQFAARLIWMAEAPLLPSRLLYDADRNGNSWRDHHLDQA